MTTRAERDALYRRAIARWGAEAQVGLATEEFAELIQAISKWRRRGLAGVPESVIEEIADAEIMLEQLELLCVERGASDVRLQVDRVKAQKARRLRDILAGGGS